MRTFLEFVDKNLRRTKKQLGILEKVLKKNGFHATAFLEEDDPYLFVKNSNNSLSFDGIRIYKIGDTMAYRVQREETTLPYGRAYGLDIESIYDDFISDDMKELEAGKEVVKSLVGEIKTFFVKSAEAEQEMQAGLMDKPISMDNAIMNKPEISDYSNRIYNNKSYSLY